MGEATNVYKILVDYLKGGYRFRVQSQGGE